MMFRLAATFLLMTSVAARINPEGNNERDLMTSKSSKSNKAKTYRVTVTNLTFRQIMSPFFAAVHDEGAPRVYMLGAPASPQLVQIAENGEAQPLVDLFNANDNVENAMIATQGGLPGGASATFEVETTKDAKYLSLASMAIHTNDCFVGVNGVKLYDGLTMMLPGLDAGSEENNELCTSIPGPACGETGNVPSGSGEGFVHVHRGFFGLDTLPADRYDWRNPMLMMKVEEM